MRSSSRKNGASGAWALRAAALCAGVLVCLQPSSASSGISDDIVLRGYVQEEPVLLHPSLTETGGGKSRLLNLLRARESLLWYAADALTFALEVEAQWLQGDDACQMADLIAPLSSDTPLLDLRAEFVEEDGARVEAVIDRFWVDVTHGNFQMTAGRHHKAVLRDDGAAVIVGHRDANRFDRDTVDDDPAYLCGLAGQRGRLSRVLWAVA